MKTYKNLYRQICDIDNIYLAYKKARRLKRYKKEVLVFTANLEENLVEIFNELTWKKYVPGIFRKFIIYEPKERLITALPFKDRVVQHALCNIIEPIFDSGFIADSYACRPGKGTLAGIKRTQFFLRKVSRRHDDIYCLKTDISKYFPSVDHEILKRILRRKIACQDTLWLMDKIIDSDNSPKGIPIGSLTSQLFANVYLNELDHFLKDRLKIKYYVRYMDDCVIIHHNKKYLRDLQETIGVFLYQNLKLKLNGKTQVFPLKSRAIDFLGYRIRTTHILPRKRNIKRTRKNFKRMARLYSEGKIDLEYIVPRVASFLGYTKNANAYRTRLEILNEFVLHRQRRSA